MTPSGGSNIRASAWARRRAQREGWSAEHVAEWTLGYWLRYRWEVLVVGRERNMKRRIDDAMQRQLGRLVPQRREWRHSAPWKPTRQSEWVWLGRSFLRIQVWQ